ncbi:MAG: translation initiation factor IF-2 [Flavobacteriales bacterium]|nr:translation initiation factor IF-2 [Flavobacteriales bacterium]
MSEETAAKRLSKVARELNIGIATIVEFLDKKGLKVEANPNSKLNTEAYEMLLREFQSERTLKEASQLVDLKKPKRETISLDEKSGKERDAKSGDQDEIMIANVQVAGVPEEEELEVEKEEPEPKKEPEPEEQKPAAKTTKAEPKKESEPVEEAPAKEVAEEKKEEPVAEEEKKEPAQPEVAPPAEEPVVEAPVGETPAAEAKPEEEKKEEPKQADPEDHVIKARANKLEGPTIVGKIDLPEPVKKPVASSSDSDIDKKNKKRKRKRIASENAPVPPGSGGGGQRGPGGGGQRGKKGPGKVVKSEPNEEEIKAQIKDTLARLSSGGKSKSSKYRRQKRQAISEQMQQDMERAEEESRILKVTEFVSASELAKMMNVQVNEIISAGMSLGLFLSINQRLDAETLSIIADEFGYKIEFISADLQEAIREEQEEEDETKLKPRPPIVTVMGHVDHGKTSLLDYVRKANVIAGEAGGITQHIGAYAVELKDNRKITFLDTPGHEAFTAMRARGAQVTDVAIIVIAADDSIMPQTVEAINHAQAAGVPLVFAINKVDKPNANPDRIKEALAARNFLVEEWGGKYQSHDISAKTGKGVEELLDKVLLEAEMLDLKANPDRRAAGTVIEATLDRGRGYVCTLLVQTGSLRVGDILLAGCHYGRVKALFNERGQTIDVAGPSTPVQILGLTGAPQAGDKFNAMDEERKAREIANKRLQLQREQGIRAQKHITLDEIGRRLAIGDFQELNVIVKGDVDGSVEALSDSLLKLSTDKIQVNVIHKSVGQITESDVLLASASNAVIVGFQIRPSLNARKLAEKEEIDIRLYSVIYDAINEVKSAMEGMLAPEMKEEVVCNVEVRDVFKISRVGTIAGCMVLDGKINRNTQVRIIRDGIVVYTGKLASLKRFKEDVKEVATGYECGLGIENFNDIKEGDIIEGYEIVPVK